MSDENQKSTESKSDSIRPSRARSAAGYAGKGAAVIIPALIGSYFTFREAKLSADIKLEELRLKHTADVSSTKGKASAGYETLVEAVEGLGKEVAKLEGRLMATEARLPGYRPRPSRPATNPAALRPIAPAPPASLAPPRGSRSPASASPSPAPAEPAPPSPAPAPAPSVLMKALPRTLDEAAEAMRR